MKSIINDDSLKLYYEAINDVAEYVSVKDLLKIVDSIHIAGVDGILDFNDGIEFVRDIIINLPRMTKDDFKETDND